MKMKFPLAETTRKWFIYSLLLVMISATAQFEPLPFQQIAAIELAKKNEPIEVLLLESPMVLHRIGNQQKWGLDEERLHDFSEQTGLKLNIRRFKSQRKLSEAFSSGQGQLVISRHQPKLDGTSEGPLLEEITFGLFCNGKSIKTKPRSEYKIRKVQHHFLPVLKKIRSRKLDCFQSEIQLGVWATRLYPEIQLYEKIPTSDHYFWQVRQTSPELKVLLHSWFRKSTRQQRFLAFQHRFEKPLVTLTTSDIKTFIRKSEFVLPKYVGAFQEAAREVQLPWTLLAAVAYQESQWNPAAVSYTGVKGLMQLTLQAAQHMNVSDREDPFESIWGGSRYLQHLWQEWAEVEDPNDRLVMTLASYNIGIAHMFDVVDLLKDRGLDPYKWSNIEKILPELENEDVHSQLRYGYARGRETVDFINRSYSFYQLLNF